MFTLIHYIVTTSHGSKRVADIYLSIDSEIPLARLYKDDSVIGLNTATFDSIAEAKAVKVRFTGDL